ncbi:hypothetical protein OOJ91_12085 [Micromonospora lupini]|uniref:hypothetical protein n=1 Tax=Micromonospora lupini TaxID=285679 RepID=UPI00225B4085|nr:hypothetical protein [Micromonospora lupini]MCX5066617.1 hypothetical protein [Micromonospora lupini]
MRACDVWLRRDFLTRLVADQGGEWLSPTTSRTSGGLVELPAPCDHPAEDCPPHPAASEPVCCGEPMVHNSWTGEYECAAAYFALVDGGVLGDTGLRLDMTDLDADQRALVEHWQSRRVVPA